MLPSELHLPSITLSAALRLFHLVASRGNQALKGFRLAIRGGEERLQVLAQPLDLVDEEVDIRLGGCRVGDHHAEEIDLVGLWLVAHHGGT